MRELNDSIEELEAWRALDPNHNTWVLYPPRPFAFWDGDRTQFRAHADIGAYYKNAWADTAREALHKLCEELSRAD